MKATLLLGYFAVICAYKLLVLDKSILKAQPLKSRLEVSLICQIVFIVILLLQ